MKLEIGKIREDEIDVVVEIDRQAFSRGSGARALDIGEEAKRPWALVWVARDEGVPVAYLVAWHVTDELHLLMIATHPDVRRRGTARALVSQLIDFSFEKNVRHIFLEVRSTNDAAIALYRAFGFHRLALRRAYYADGEDAIEMALALDPQTKTILRRDDEPI